MSQTEPILQMGRRTQPQKKISNSNTRFNVASWGRQSGKTTFGLQKMLWKPLSGPENGIYWYILQTSTAAEVAFNRFWKMMRSAPDLLMQKPNESERFFKLVGDRYIYFKSGHEFENLRVETLHGCIIDEVRQQDSKLWPMVIRPMLANKKGWCDFLSTPNGFDHFYDLFQMAKDYPEEWSSYYAPSTEAWWWTPEEIASAKSTMTPEEFDQEIMASFINLFTGRTYTFSRNDNISASSPFSLEGTKWHPYLPILVGLDFNVNPMSWTIGQNKLKQFYWFDEIYVRNTNTMECANALVEKIRGLINSGHRAKPSVIFVGDPAGNARNTKSTESDFVIIETALRNAGISFENRTPKDHPPVKERVNTVNAHLKSADGNVNLWVHPDCKHLIYDLERCAWKQGDALILDKSNPDLTHSTDSIGYPIHALSPLTGSGNVGRLVVLRR